MLCRLLLPPFASTAILTSPCSALHLPGQKIDQRQLQQGLQEVGYKLQEVRQQLA